MKTNLIKGKKSSELHIDAYRRLSKKEFVQKLAGIDEIEVINSDTFFSSGPFCTFEYKGEKYTANEEESDYTYSIIPSIHNAESLQALDNFFTNLQIPKRKTRPAFWFTGILLVGIVIYAKVFSS